MDSTSKGIFILVVILVGFWFLLFLVVKGPEILRNRSLQTPKQTNNAPTPLNITETDQTTQSTSSQGYDIPTIDNPKELSEEEYIAVMTRNIQKTERYYNQITQSFNDFQDSRTKGLETFSRIEASLNSVYNETYGIKPPQKYESVHQRFLLALDNSVNGLDLLAESIQTENSDTLEQSIQLIEKGKQQFDQAKSLIIQ